MSLLDLPGSWRNGERAEPPYFFGVLDASDLDRWDHEDPFASQGWIDHCLEYAGTLGLGADAGRSAAAPRRSWARSIARRLLRRGSVPRHLRHPHTIARRTVAEAGSISILDVGGGFGDNFALLMRSLPEETARKVDYCVVDNEPSIELGRTLYGTREIKPRFSVAIPDERFDLVLAVGSIEYVIRWREMCEALRKASRRHVFITRAPLALNVPTFYTVQSVCPAMGPSAGRQVGLARVAVINKVELNAAMTGDGWSLSHDERLEDYSRNFARLPKPYDRGIVYAALSWRAPKGR
jgi:putative methyltransferase (TIGR04325 family)